MGKTWRNKPEDGFKVKRKNQPTEKRKIDYDTDNQDNYESEVFSDSDKYDSDKFTQ